MKLMNHHQELKKKKKVDRKIYYRVKETSRLLLPVQNSEQTYMKCQANLNYQDGLPANLPLF